MTKTFTTIVAVFALLFVLSPMVFAESSQEALEKCKAEADADDVVDADIKNYVSNCMKDLGINANEIKKLVHDEYSHLKLEKDQSQD